MWKVNAVSILIGHIHSVLKLDSRHFGIVAASEYKSLGEHVDMHSGCGAALCTYNVHTTPISTCSITLQIL